MIIGWRTRCPCCGRVIRIDGWHKTTDGCTGGGMDGWMDSVYLCVLGTLAFKVFC